jgi:NAD(P)-dependent dehydrogenase (short-subunit alcohol dehydrogenase family)
MTELAGKVAVTAGTGSGMGRAAAEVFGRERAKVLAADSSGQQDDTATALGDAVVAFPVDVSDEASVEAMFAAALESFGKVDAVLNVAGIAGAAPLADLTGVMLGTKHGIRAMLPS